MLFDYRGYGGNPGTPTESGLAKDARAARSYLEGRDDVDPERIVYFGESLGAGVAVGLAVERPPAALMLRSPFASLVAAARFHYPFLPVGLILKDRYPSIDRIPALECPLLVLAGTADGVVPFEQSRRLFDAARTKRKQFVTFEGADHNDVEFVSGRRMFDEIDDFLESTEAP